MKICDKRLQEFKAIYTKHYNIKLDEKINVKELSTKFMDFILLSNIEWNESK